MTKDEALKMAIEQIQHLIEIYIPSPEWSRTAIQKECYETINACKEALEQQEVGDAEIKAMLDDIEWYQQEQRKLIDRIKALEQPSQDYVLICKKCGDDLGIEYVPDEQALKEKNNE